MFIPSAYPPASTGDDLSAALPKTPFTGHGIGSDAAEHGEEGGRGAETKFNLDMT